MFLSIDKCYSRPSRLGRVLLAASLASSYRSKHDKVDIVKYSSENFGSTAELMRVLAVVVCSSVRPSVCRSVYSVCLSVADLGRRAGEGGQKSRDEARGSRRRRRHGLRCGEGFPLRTWGV